MHNSAICIGILFNFAGYRSGALKNGILYRVTSLVAFDNSVNRQLLFSVSYTMNNSIKKADLYNIPMNVHSI